MVIYFLYLLDFFLQVLMLLPSQIKWVFPFVADDVSRFLVRLVEVLSDYFLCPAR